MAEAPDSASAGGGGIGPAIGEGRGPYASSSPSGASTIPKAHPAGPPRGARRRVRDRLRARSPTLDLQVHRHVAAGGVLSRGPCAARRRRRARARPARGPGPQRRRARCREPRLEARPGDPGDFAREPAGHLPRRTAPGGRPRVAQHHGAGRARRPDDRSRPSETPCTSCSAWKSRAGASPGCSPAWTSTTTSETDTRCSVGACPTSTS